jgi:hypothetical protein
VSRIRAELQDDIAMPKQPMHEASLQFLSAMLTRCQPARYTRAELPAADSVTWVSLVQPC